GLAVGVVVGYLGPRMRADDAQIREQSGDGVAGHRGAPISVHDVWDAVGAEDLFHHLLGQLAAFAGVHMDPDDVTRVNVDHHVGVVVDPFDRAGQFGDVPRIHLPRR